MRIYKSFFRFEKCRKACKYRLYRLMRTYKEIVKNYILIYMTYLMLFLLISSVLFFFKVVIIDLLDGERYDWYIISMIVLFLIIQCVPDPVQAFYWFNGSLYYLGFFSLLLYMVGIWVQLSWDE